MLTYNILTLTVSFVISMLVLSYECPFALSNVGGFFTQLRGVNYNFSFLYIKDNSAASITREISHPTLYSFISLPS